MCAARTSLHGANVYTLKVTTILKGLGEKHIQWQKNWDGLRLELSRTPGRST